MDRAEELAFARAMLAEPESAMHRLAYADRLEECGDARAVLVREVEGWGGFFPPDRDYCEIWDDWWPQWYWTVFAPIPTWPYLGHGGAIARVNLSTSVGEAEWYVRPDGEPDPAGGPNLAWIVSLAMARGLKVPGWAGNRGNPPDGY